MSRTPGTACRGIGHNVLVGSGKRVGARRKRRFDAVLLLLALGVTLCVVAWGYLVKSAIDFGVSARGGESDAWLFLGLASLGAVACLFVGLILVAKVFRRLTKPPAGSSTGSEQDDPRAAPRPGRPAGHARVTQFEPHRRRTSGGALPGLLIAGLVVVGAIAFSPSAEFEDARGLLGIGEERRGTAPNAPRGVGSYRFSMTQPGSNQPVGYDPCEPIRVVHNPQNAPANAQELLETAIRHTEEATGLRIDLAGTSDERDFLDRYGGFARRGEPVLVGWATAEEVPELAGDVAGLGGSTAIELRPGRMEYVTGTVVLDQELFDDLDDDPANQSDAQGIVDHEFGHLVGLDHVNDPRELMHAQQAGVTTYGPGDLEGLARLGSIRCS